VNVGIEILRHVVVYNVRNSLHVDTARGDIRRDEHSVTAVLKAVQSLLALTLREVSVHGRYMLPLARELLSETLRGVFHLREHNNEGFTILLKPVR
jgi:hypothetical protein